MKKLAVLAPRVDLFLCVGGILMKKFEMTLAEYLRDTDERNI